MGYMVPLPPTWTRLENGFLRNDASALPWRCSYCYTVQKSQRLDCCNCGAPRPGSEEAAAWVADQTAKRMGIKRR